MKTVRMVTVMVTATVLAATMAFGAASRSDQDGAWANSATWGDDVVPTIANGNRAKINDDVTVETAQGVGKAYVGNNNDGSLTIESDGSYDSTLNTSFLHIGEGGEGTFVLNGGEADITTVGVGAGNTGSLTIDSGTFVAGDMSVGTNGTGTVDLFGGSMELTDDSTDLLTIDSNNGMLNIENDAELIIAGDQQANIGSFVSGNDIAWDNGSGIAGIGDRTWDDGSGNFLHSAYDGTEDETTVWVNTIPEPATLWVLVVAGVGLLMVHRRRTSVD